jgi:hypothetical protein
MENRRDFTDVVDAAILTWMGIRTAVKVVEHYFIKSC